MMTLEEAIEIFEQKGWWIAQKETLTSKQAEEIIKLNDAVNLALSALRPVSRERVEKLRGEWIPAESDFDDDDTLFDVENWCDWQCSACHNEVCYDDPMERRWLPKFCPNCGTHMTDEAVQMVMERLEELHETV